MFGMVQLTKETHVPHSFLVHLPTGQMNFLGNVPYVFFS